jgi:putative membrane protein
MNTVSKFSVFFLAAYSMLFSQPYHHMGGWHTFGWTGGVMIILWIVLIAALVFAFVQLVNKGNLSAVPKESALDILKKRYAKGEITKEEFERMKKELT